MNPNLTLVLMLVVFAVITVFLFSPSTDCGHGRETYSNDTIDPTLHPYSKHVTFRPHTTGITTNDGSSFQLYDHIDDQNYAMMSRAVGDNMKKSAHIENINKGKHVRFADDLDNAVIPPVRNVDIKTSHSNTHINRNRVTESNNISGYCVSNGHVDDDSMAYSDQIHEVLDMDMDDETYHQMMAMRPHMKTYIEIDEDSGKYNQKQGKGKQDIEGLDELTNVMNAYRNNTLNTIRGGSNANKYYYKNTKMYNPVLS